MTQYAVPGAPPPPPVVTWFKVYAGFMSILYLLVAALSLLFFVGFIEQDDRTGAVIAGVALLGVGGLFFALFAVSFILKPRPGVWIYDLVLIALGLTSCLTIPVCIPLLIFWLKPEAQRYFGRL
jgi:MFS family permease